MLATFFVNLWFLLFAHYVADFALQSDFMSKYKYKLPYVMFVHCFIWTTCLVITTMIFGISASIWIWPIMFIIHFATDWYKCHLIAKFDPTSIIPDETLRRYFYNDQLVHVIQIVFIAAF